MSFVFVLCSAEACLWLAARLAERGPAADGPMIRLFSARLTGMMNLAAALQEPMDPGVLARRATAHARPSFRRSEWHTGAVGRGRASGTLVAL